MKLTTPFTLAAGLFLAAGLLAGSSHAAVITCNDTNLDYSDTCPSAGTSGRCINPIGGPFVNLNGCCNKGTCNGSVCVTGPDQDANCINDGNDCVDQQCHADAQLQPSCTPTNAPSTRDCNADNNVCTVDKCNGSGTCAYTGTTNTCAAEQATNDQPICSPYVCDATNGCQHDDVDNSPVVACDDGKDCTTGDHCINGTCAKGASGTVLQNGEPCRDDDTSPGNGDSRTWCNHGTCDDTDEACDHTVSENAGAACHPNPCTNGTCATNGGVCTITSCNSGSSVYCGPCGTTLSCVNYGVGQNGNYPNACGCLSTY